VVSLNPKVSLNPIQGLAKVHIYANSKQNAKQGALIKHCCMSGIQTKVSFTTNIIPLTVQGYQTITTRATLTAHREQTASEESKTARFPFPCLQS
jgi:hypothetical protein